MSKGNKINSVEIKWSSAMSIEKLSKIYNVHRNTMSKWLKDQTVCNRQLSPRKWEVALFEMPYDLTRDNQEMISKDVHWGNF